MAYSLAARLGLTETIERLGRTMSAAPLSNSSQDYTQQASSTDLKHIPGAYGWPFIGVAPQLFSDQLGLSRQRYAQYGELSRVQLGRDKGLLALGPDLAQEILLDKNRNFSSKMGYKRKLNPFFGESFLLGNDFDEHKFQRRIMQTGFKTPAMRGYVDLMNPILERGIANWDFDNHFLFYTRIKELLLKTSLKVFYGVDGDSDIAAKLSQAFIDVTVGQLGVFEVDLPGYKFHIGKKATRLLRSYIADLLPERRENEGKDMLSYMAKERKPDGELFSDEELIDHASFLLFAAHDTTTSTLTHMMYYLALFPQWQEKIRQEGHAVSDQYLTYEDLSKVTTLEQVFFEAQRLHPSVQVMVRRSIEACQLAGHDVPANTLIFQFPIFTNRMEQYWTNPDQFDPERFSPERAENKAHPFCFMLFGGGAHKCIGMHFASMQAKLFSHIFLKHHRVRLIENYKPEFMTVPLPKLKDHLPLVVEAIAENS